MQMFLFFFFLFSGCSVVFYGTFSGGIFWVFSCIALYASSNHRPEEKAKQRAAGEPPSMLSVEASYAMREMERKIRH